MKDKMSGWGIVSTLMTMLLSISSITAATLGGPYITDADTVALYHVNDGAGTAVSDSSGNGYNGALYGSNTWVSPAQYLGGLQTASGQTGGFNATISVSGNNFTVEGWFNPNSASGMQYIFGGQDSSGGNIFYVRQQDAYFAYGIYDTGAGAWREVTGGSITAGQWYHIAVTAFNSTGNEVVLSLYQNNVMAGRSSYTFTTLPGTVTNFKVGRCPWSNTTTYFPGKIDEVRVSNTPRYSFTIPVNSQPNLAANGDFETANGSYPASWTRQIDSGTVVQSWSTSQKVSTSHSVKTVISSVNAQADWNQLITNIDAGLKYRFRSHVYASVVTAGSHALELHWLNSGNTELTPVTSYASTAAGQWSELIGEDIQPPAGAVKVYIKLRTYKQGTYYFDDVVLQRKDEEVCLVDGKFPLGVYAPVSKNLLRNSDFELEGNSGLPLGWTRLYSSGTVAQTWDASYRVSGTHSVKSAVTADGQSDWRQTVYNINPALTYKLYGQIYASNISTNSHSLSVQWFDSAGSYLGENILTSPTADQWVQVSQSAISPPAGTAQAIVVLRAYKTGTYYFDDVFLDVDWTVADRLNDLKNGGFNFLGTYNGEFSNNTYFYDLNDCANAGLKGCLYPLPELYLPDDTNLAALIAAINAVENHSALALWFSPDEPTLRNPIFTAQGVTNAYNQVLATDDYYITAPHKVWLNHPPRGTGSDLRNFTLLRDYNAGADIISMDVYPAPESCGFSNLPNQTLSCIGDYTDILYNQVVSWNNATTPRNNQGKPIWMSLQGYVVDDGWTGDECKPYSTHGIELQWYDVNDNYLGSFRLPATTPEVWCYESEQSITPPAGATQVYVLLRTYWSGTYYFDNINFGEVGGAFLLSNNTFETANGSMPASWGTWVASGTTVAQTWDTSKYISSSHSVKTVMTSATGQADWREHITGISDTKKYYLSGYVYAQRRPLWEQTRFMAYNAIIHGARGIVYYGLEFIPVTSGLWQDIKRLATELDGLSSVLTSPKSFRNVSVSNGNVETLLLKSGNYLYLVAANRRSADAGNVTISVSGLPLSAITRIYETGNLTITSNSFTDSFNGYQVHIYRLN